LAINSATAAKRQRRETMGKLQMAKIAKTPKNRGENGPREKGGKKVDMSRCCCSKGKPVAKAQSGGPCKTGSKTARAGKGSKEDRFALSRPTRPKRHR
jgi:hypothetical protein